MSGVESERLQHLNDAEPADGRYVLYWMQASQRAEHNPALEHAGALANRHRVPLVVSFVLMPDYPEASARHFAFMLGGLGRTLPAVERRGIRPCLRVGEPIEIISELATDAVEVVVDRGYLRHQRAWYDELGTRLSCPITQVEGDVVVPTALVSQRREHAARTIRPKINEHRDRFLVDLDTVPIEVTSTPDHTTSDIEPGELADPDGVRSVLDRLGLHDGPGAVDGLTPGTAGARSRLRSALDHQRADGYDETRNRFTDPLGTSGISPHLHHGQISPVDVALRVIDEFGDEAEPFLEELVVRRELAINFVLHEPEYDRYGALPEWARTSLADHRDDERDRVYTAAELEAAETHDDVWNAIMRTIKTEGWVHNQLRMYWGKQIVRWTNTPDFAHRTLLELNNRWFLDGRDPNSFANVGWCFGLHDQGFAEREVSGKLRPFTTAALRRKDDLDAWVEAHAD